MQPDMKSHEGQAPRVSGQGRLLVHIAFHFVSHRTRYLETVIAGIAGYELDQVLIVIDSNTDAVADVVAGLQLPSHCTLRVDVHSGLVHPFDLTWAHRKDMELEVAGWDYFMYLEDDIHVPWTTFKQWLARSESVSRRGFIHGFLRVEVDAAGRTVSTDWRLPLRQPAMLEIQGAKYIRPLAFYQACWVYSRATMQEFIKGAAWKRGFHRWSAVTRGHRNLGAANYSREFAAFGMSCAAPGRPRVLLPLDVNGQVDSSAWVWHLPNNYADNPGMRLMLASELIEGGSRSSVAGESVDSALEGLRWAAYFLRTEQLAGRLRHRARSLLGRD